MKAMPRGWTVLMVSGAVALPIVVAAVPQEAPSTSVKDGVYSAAQAERGAQAYRADCSSCHAADLQGSGQAPPLAGDEFLATWRGPLFDLFDRIHSTMPADRPGQLAPERTADILAFMLKISGLPAGPRDLPGDEAALKTIRLDVK